MSSETTKRPATDPAEATDGPEVSTRPSARARAEALGIADLMVWTEDGQRLEPHIANATTLLALCPEWAGKLYVDREELPAGVESARWDFAKGVRVGEWLRLAPDAPIFACEAPARPDDAPVPWDGWVNEDVARVACWLARSWRLLLPIADVALAAVLVAKAQARGETRREWETRTWPLRKRQKAAVAAQQELARAERLREREAHTWDPSRRGRTATGIQDPHVHRQRAEAADAEAARLEAMPFTEWGPGGSLSTAGGAA